MPWWSWIVLGMLLLGAELFGIDAAFYLVFIGIAAVITGLLELSGAGMEPWLQWLVFAALALTAMVLFRKRLYTKLRKDIPDYPNGPAGETLRLANPLNPGESCRQDYRGTTWTIVNGSDHALEQGMAAMITEVKGLTLVVSAPDSTKS